MTTFDRITSNPNILNGQPAVRGMRLSVRRVIEALAVYPNWDDLRREFLALEPDDIRQSLFASRSNSLHETWTRAYYLSKPCESPSAGSGPAAFSSCLLRQTGCHVVHDSELGMSRAGDTDILQRARAEACACITLDADFHSLRATSGELGPSVIRIRK